MSSIDETPPDIITGQFEVKMESSWVGDLLVTSMDRDGTQVGYDI